MSLDDRRVAHLIGGCSHAFVTGELEWHRQPGSALVARLPVFAEDFEPDAVVLNVRLSPAAPEMLCCAVVLDDVAVRRACWNRPHKEGGEQFDHPSHGHRWSQGRCGVYVPDAPLSPVDENDPNDWARREALSSFLDWSRISRDALLWTEPTADGGGRP